MGNTELDRLLQEGIAAARAGQRERAHELLLQVIALDENVEAAWLWLSGVVDDPGERQICLENVLALNPDNTAARQGLRWLATQGSIKTVEPVPAPSSEKPEPVQLASSAVLGEPSAPEPVPSPSLLVQVEIDPFGCPYCGGSVTGEEARCDDCHRLVTVRDRKRAGAAGLGWLALSFLLLGAATWLEGFLVSQSVEIGPLPQWLSQTAVRWMVGAALLSPEGIPGSLTNAADLVTLINMLLAGLCVLAAAGLALRSRAVYFGSFLLAGVLVIAIGAGLLTQLTGWLPALFRLGLLTLVVKWLVDSATAFEWETRRYDADVDQDLRTDLDYYDRGQYYYEMGMWAKAAAHWKVATRLAPNQAQYHVSLAKAYAKMGYLAAAQAETDKAGTLAPEDEDLRTWRDSLSELEESH